MWLCGIAGVVGRDKFLFKRVFPAIFHRGKDGRRVLELPQATIGFVRHRVVGDVMQPLFDGKSVFLANCEIYNYSEIAKEYGITGRNDAEVFYNLIKRVGVERALEIVEGQYAMFYLDLEKERVLLARDPFGIAPLFFRPFRTSLVFSSSALSFTALELNPRTRVYIDLEENIPKVEEKYIRDVFERGEQLFGREELFNALKRAVRYKIKENGAIAVSSGVDSLLISAIANEIRDLPLVHVYHKPKEVDKVRDIARKMGWEVFFYRVNAREAIEALSLLGERILAQPLKLSFSLVFYFVSRFTREELDEKVVITGMGADELFCGYRRMVRDPRKEARWALYTMYERSLTPVNEAGFLGGAELRHPYLSSAVLEIWRDLPDDLLKEKRVLKEILSEVYGIQAEKKIAAQYGSGFNEIVRKGKSILGNRKRPAFLLSSGGKDSWAAALIGERAGYGLKGVLTYMPGREDSWMFHYPATSLVRYQAFAAGLDLLALPSTGEKDDALKELVEGFTLAKKKFLADTVISGAILSEFQRDLIQKAAEAAGISVFAPLWAIDQEKYLRFLIKNGFSFVIVALGIEEPRDLLGKVISSPEDVEYLIKIARKYKFNPAGEGGEYETFVVRCPLWKRNIEEKLRNLLRRLLKV